MTMKHWLAAAALSLPAGAFAQSAGRCPELPAGSGLAWETAAGDDFLFCKAMREDGQQPLICAADTCRAAAVDQLQIWADRAGVDIVRAKEGSDPASASSGPKTSSGTTPSSRHMAS